MLTTLTVPPGVTLVLVGGPILTTSSNPALRVVNLEVVGGTTLGTPGLEPPSSKPGTPEKAWLPGSELPRSRSVMTSRCKQWFRVDSTFCTLERNELSIEI